MNRRPAREVAPWVAHPSLELAGCAADAADGGGGNGQRGIVRGAMGVPGAKRRTLPS